MPALLMTISSPPKCAATASTTVLILSRLATSSGHALALPPLAVISAATACAPSAAKSVTATWAPSAANTRAVARPMPLAAPVTRTVSPATDRLSCLNSDMRCSVPIVFPTNLDLAHTSYPRCLADGILASSVPRSVASLELALRLTKEFSRAAALRSPHKIRSGFSSGIKPISPSVEYLLKMMPCAAGLTRLAPIRREVKPSRNRCNGQYYRSADSSPGDSGLRPLQGHPAGGSEKKSRGFRQHI